MDLARDFNVGLGFFVELKYQDHEFLAGDCPSAPKGVVEQL